MEKISKDGKKTKPIPNKKQTLPYSNDQEYQDDLQRVLQKDYLQDCISPEEVFDISKSIDSYLKGMLFISKNKISV